MVCRLKVSCSCCSLRPPPRKGTGGGGGGLGGGGLGGGGGEGMQEVGFCVQVRSRFYASMAQDRVSGQLPLAWLRPPQSLGKSLNAVRVWNSTARNLTTALA